MNRNVLTAVFGLVSSAVFATEAPAPAAKADPAKGRAIVEKACVACHGIDGNSAASSNPSLAGQHAGYIYAQLVAYKKGERKNPIMLGQVAALSEQDMKNVSAYFAEQKPKVRASTDKSLQAAGKRIYQGGNVATGVPACIACHGPSGAGIPVQYPRLGGQHAAYTASQLLAYKDGELRKNQVMHEIALKLTANDIKAVSQYIEGLH